jgi:outer membrane protein assembly factor BamB
MNLDDVLLLGVKSRVLAISKRDGKIIWSTELPGGIGDGFVTLLSDGISVFAHTHGQLHCLDSANGRIIWTNELPGCGYGLASLWIAGNEAAPNTAVARQLIAQKQAAAATSASSGAH